jgi:hypothetical protein
MQKLVLQVNHLNGITFQFRSVATDDDTNTGSIPSELSQLSSLNELYLINNQLTGNK